MTLCLRGFKNGTLTGVSPTEKRSGNSIVWRVKCECGYTGELPARELVHAKSLAHPRCPIRANSIHPLWDIWRGIIDRCENPQNKNYKNYGGRGIKVCPQWRQDFKVFVADLGTRPTPYHSVDREDNDGDYTPTNCHWATSKQQANNQRPRSLRTDMWADIYKSKQSVEELATKWKVSIKTVRNIRSLSYSPKATLFCLGLLDDPQIK